MHLLSNMIRLQERRAFATQQLDETSTHQVQPPAKGLWTQTPPGSIQFVACLTLLGTLMVGFKSVWNDFFFYLQLPYDSNGCLYCGTPCSDEALNCEHFAVKHLLLVHKCSRYYPTLVLNFIFETVLNSFSKLQNNFLLSVVPFDSSTRRHWNCMRVTRDTCSGRSWLF
jgi:hypothetical protein